MSMWGNTTDAISSLPFRDAILTLFTADTLELRFQLIEKNLAVLTSHATLDAFEQDIEQSWEQGDRAMADFLWQMQQLLRRVREQGLDSTITVYKQPIQNVHDSFVRLERSSMPFQTWIGIFTLLDAINTGSERATLEVLVEFEDQFRQPIAAAVVRDMSRVPSESTSPISVHYEQVIQLLESISHGQDLQSVAKSWRPSKPESLEELGEPKRTVALYLQALVANWHAAQVFVKRNYNVLLARSALEVVRGSMRNAWQSDRNLGERMWRSLRLLEHARMFGIDVAFHNLIWSPNAEQFWRSEREIGMMEAANVPLDDLRSLQALVIALISNKNGLMEEWRNNYWDEAQNPVVANYARYMAEVALVEGDSSNKEAWNSLADWLDEIRGEDSQSALSGKTWEGIPALDDLTFL